jgi:TolB protein
MLKYCLIQIKHWLKYIYVRALALILAFFCSSLALNQAQEPPPPTGQLREQLSIIVRPGGEAVMVIPDFAPASRDGAAAAAEFSQVLFDDLQFAGAVTVVGRSLYPQTVITDPLKVDFSLWSKEPIRANYLTCGSVLTSGDQLLVETYVYDVQTGNRLLATQYRGDGINQVRPLAHRAANEIVKLLTGVEGIALSKIAFVSQRTGHREIYVMDYDGHQVRQLTFNRGISLFPNWSPDGQKIAYLSLTPGAAVIHIRSAADGLSLGAFHYKGTISSPAYSPDGTRLAFCSSKDSNSMQLYVADLTTGRNHQLTNTRSVVHTSPRWNPRTGREIAFISDESGSPQIYVINADGGNLRRLLDKGGAADSPAWSPNGQYLAFSWRPPGSPNFDIYIMDISTRQIVQLTNGAGSNESPAWSPNGRHLVFQSNRTGRFELHLMQIDGTQIKQVTTGGGTSPAWGR